MTERFLEGATIPYEAYFVDANGDGITTAAGKISIRRKSNNQYWNGATWQAANFQLTMTKVGDANSPGFWEFDFDSTVGDAVDDYVALMSDSSGNAVNRPDPRFDFVGGYLDLIEDQIDAQNLVLTKILGLNHENFVLDPTEFAAAPDNEMTKGQVRIYDTAANATTDDGSTGIINKYDIDAPRTNGKMDKFIMTLLP